MTVSERFLNMGEPLLAGLYENTDRGLFYRKALGRRRYYEAMPAPAYQPGRLYPSGARPSSGTVDPNYMGGYWYDINRLREKDREMADLFASSELFRYHSSVPKEHTVAGDMWTHSMPDTQRILVEGFDSYDARTEKIEHGDLGVKTGKGFHDWHGVDLKDLNDRIAAPWWHLFNWELPTE